MIPTITFIRNLIEPVNTFRATSVAQMFDTQWSKNDFLLRYDVGIQSTIPTSTLTVRNRTVSHDLSIQLDVPEWYALNFVSQFILNRDGEKRVITFSFNESAVQGLSKTRQFQFNHDISVAVTPMQVNGPVYVMNSTDPL